MGLVDDAAARLRAEEEEEARRLAESDRGEPPPYRRDWTIELAELFRQSQIPLLPVYVPVANNPYGDAGVTFWGMAWSSHVQFSHPRVDDGALSQWGILLTPDGTLSGCNVTLRPEGSLREPWGVSVEHQRAWMFSNFPPSPLEDVWGVDFRDLIGVPIAVVLTRGDEPQRGKLFAW